jgi:2-oxoglutarate ferredoxin oxidoreductase subunit delta
MDKQLFIDTKLCKSCQICKNTCPKHVLEVSNELNDMGISRIIVQHLDQCIGCRQCELCCPDFAISVKILKKPEIEKDEKNDKN